MIRGGRSQQAGFPGGSEPRSMSEVLAAVRGVWRYLFTGRRLARMGGDLDGAPDSPRIAPHVVAGPGVILSSRSAMPHSRPQRRVDDSQAILAARVFGR